MSVKRRRAVSKSSGDLAFEPLGQDAAAFVVQAAASHVDGLDARRLRAANGLVVAVQHHEVVLHEPLEGRQRQMMGHGLLARRIGDRENEAIVGEADRELVGSVAAAFEREGVGVEKVVDGDLALVLDVGVAARNRVLIERDLAQPVRGLGCFRGVAFHGPKFSPPIGLPPSAGALQAPRHGRVPSRQARASPAPPHQASVWTYAS